MFHFPNNLVIIYSHVLTQKRRPVFFLEAPQPAGFLLGPFLVTAWRRLSVLNDVLRATAMKLMRCIPCKLHGEVRCLEGTRHFFLELRWVAYPCFLPTNYPQNYPNV